MKTPSKNVFSRQSFLGLYSQDQIERCVIGIVGLGGGGSHIAQQLAHLGFLNFYLIDPDRIEDTNLNRLIGGTQEDVEMKTLKVDIAKRLILGIRPKAHVEALPYIWQERADMLKRCDLIFGGVDGYDQRRQLEGTARHYLIPLIDIGMDVIAPEGSPPEISGQVILSMPGEPCMTCMGFLNEASLKLEAQKYGDAGINPQVVWSNGVLASTAVGLAVDLVTDWSKSLRKRVYLCYQGSTGTLTPHVRLDYLPAGPCPHYPIVSLGDPKLRRL
jgi:hypothetical protein